FARMSPLGVYTYAFGFHSDNLTPFWTVSQRVDRFIDTLKSVHVCVRIFKLCVKHNITRRKPNITAW
ncbi:MAG: hypothetical protein IJN71_02250, partial [Oscillospiraceae bacterium]|nr:hypothetical protein [Oscillospiraceae bacterium]